jgi:hypothetical protein
MTCGIERSAKERDLGWARLDCSVAALDTDLLPTLKPGLCTLEIRRRSTPSRSSKNYGYLGGQERASSL